MLLFWANNPAFRPVEGTRRPRFAQFLSVGQRQTISPQKSRKLLRVLGQGMIQDDRQTIFCTVVHGDAERRVVVARPIEDSVRLVTVLPKSSRPQLRAHVVAAACQFSRHSPSGEARTVNRYQPQIAAHFRSCDGAPGEIVECQDSYGRIAEERLGKAHCKGGSQIAHAKLPGRIVEAMNRLAAARRAEPKRMRGLRVNSHPAGPGSHTA
jgi:hypothetical protein